MTQATLCKRLATLAALAGAGWLLQLSGCNLGSSYETGDGCIGPDGYNWCIPGGGWDEIHSPTVEPWDFSDTSWE